MLKKALDYLQNMGKLNWLQKFSMFDFSMENFFYSDFVLWKSLHSLPYSACIKSSLGSLLKYPGLNFLKSSIKQPMISKKKSILLFYLFAYLLAYRLYLTSWSRFLGKVYETNSSIFFSNPWSLERPGLIIETLEYLPWPC